MRPSESARRASAEFEPLGRVLDAFLDRSGIGESLERLTALNEWPEVVGARVSRVTRAVAVQGDALVVEVASSAWIHELSTIRGMILEKLNEHRSGPAIGRIRFRLAESADRMNDRNRLQEKRGNKA